MTTSTYRRGHFVWRELMTSDLEASKTFYNGLFGWEYKTSDMPGGTGKYTEIKCGENFVGGMMPLSAIGKEGVPPHWMPYVSIANVDESAAAAKANGGTAPMEPQTIPTVGRMTVIGDGQHAYTSCINLETGDPPMSERPGPGEFCWEQLNTTDKDSASAFYAKVYGWETKDFPHGGGLYVFHAGEPSVASLMPAPEGTPAHWLTYVVVPNLAAARDRVTELGGKIMVPEIAVPNVGTIGVITDNVGCHIGLFEAPQQG